MASATLKHQMYEHMYPDHAEPVSLSEISDAIQETLRNLRVATPQKKLISWSAKEVGRWTAALPVPGLAEAVSSVLVDINGAELSTLSEEDLSAAGLTSKVHRSQLIKARDALLKRDARNEDSASEADSAGFADAVGFLTGAMKEDPSAQQAEAFEMLAGASVKGGRFGEAILLLQKAVEIREELEGEGSTEVAATLQKLGAVLEASGNVEEAEVTLWRALKLCDASESPDDAAVADLLEALIIILDKQGRVAEAEKLGERLDNMRTVSTLDTLRQNLKGDNVRRAGLYLIAAVLFLQLVAPEVLEPLMHALPTSWRFQWQYRTSQTRLKLWETVHGEGHPSTVPHVQHLAMLLDSHGRLDLSAEQWTKVLDIATTRMDPQDPLAATALAKLGDIALKRGMPRDAESLLTKAIRIWTTTPHVYEATDLAATQSLLAEVVMRSGRYVEAEPLYRQAQHVQEQYHEYIDDGVMARNLAGLGQVLSAVGKHEEAEVVTERALQLAEGLAEKGETSELLERVMDTAEVMESMGNFVKAGTLFKRAADLAMKTLGVYNERVAHAFSSLAACLAQLNGKGGEADTISLKSVEVASLGSGGAHTLTAAKYMARRGGLLAAAKRHKEAEDLLLAAKGVIESHPGGAESLEMASVLTNLGGVLLNRGDTAGATASMKKALEIKMRVYGERHPNVGDAAANLAIVYASLGMESEVDELLRSAEVAWEAGFGSAEGQSRLGLAQARVRVHAADAAGPRAA